MLRRAGFALFVLVAMLLSPVGASATAEAIVGDIDAFWADYLWAAGVPYESPTVVAVTEPLETLCGSIDPSFGPGAYCPVDGTLFYAPYYFDMADAFGSFALYTVVSHEWGHHIQWLLGVDGASMWGELQADCMAGAYLQSAEDRGWITAGMVSQSIGLAAKAGDLSILPVDGVAHGSPAERAISVMNGYQYGTSGCGLGF